MSSRRLKKSKKGLLKRLRLRINNVVMTTRKKRRRSQKRR